MFSGLYCSTLKMEGVDCTKMLVIFYQIARCDISSYSPLWECHIIVMKNSFDIRNAEQPDVTFEFDIHSLLGSDTLESLAYCLWVILGAPQQVTLSSRKLGFSIILLKGLNKFLLSCFCQRNKILQPQNRRIPATLIENC